MMEIWTRNLRGPLIVPKDPKPASLGTL